MSQTSTPEQQAPAEPAKTQKVKPRTDTRPKRQPPYAVVLHNDPVNHFDYVARVLQKVFHYGGGKCLWLTLRAHVAGRCIVWTGTLELAELKVQQVRDCHPDPANPAAPPIKTTAEALPA